MNINWNEVFSKKFWFDVDPSFLHRSDYAILYIGIALILLSIAMHFYKITQANKFIKQFAASSAGALMTTGIFLALWFGARHENAPALGTKLAAVIIFALGALWLYFPIRNFYKNYNNAVEAENKKLSKDKYLNFKNKK